MVWHQQVNLLIKDKLWYCLASEQREKTEMANLVSQVCLCSARVTLCQESNLGALANGNFNLIELDHFM